MKKRIFGRLTVIALTIALAMGLCVPSAFAAVNSGDCGTGVRWTFESSSGTLTISGRGAMKDYSYYSPAPWADLYRSIRKVTVGEGVTKIGSYAFYEGRRESEYESLRSLSLASTVESIGNYAFYECSALSSVALPAGLTSIGEYAFGDCKGLRTVTGLDSVTDLGRFAFSECETLSSADLSERLTAIPEGAFEDCAALRSVSFPAGLVSIGAEAFEGCAGLTAAELPEGLSVIGDGAFEGCAGLRTVTVPETVTSLGRGAFEECVGLETINYNAADAKVDVYYYGEYEPPFGDCYGVRSLVIGDGVRSIHSHAFMGLRNLTSLTLGVGLREIGERAFYGCVSISDVYYGGSASDWRAVTVDPGNDSLASARFHYEGGSAAPDPDKPDKPVIPAGAEVTVDTVTAAPGGRVTVPVRISGNPGLATFNLQMNFDRTRLTPVSVDKGAVLTAGTLTSNIQQGGDMKSYGYVTAYWVNPSDISGDGVLFTVTFDVSASAGDGDIPLTLKFKPGDAANQNMEDVDLTASDGAVRITSVIMGDVNSDGAVNSKDGLKLSQYLAKWEVPMTASELSAADVEKDGAVNSKDGLKLSQYLAKWDVSIQGAAAVMTAGGHVAFAVDSVSTSAGSYVDVPVRITHNTGMATFNLELDYDSSDLTPVSIETGPALSQGSLTSNLHQGGSSGRLDEVTAYWVNPANITDTGVAFTVRFKVSPSAVGSLPVDLSYEAGDLPLTQGFEELRTDIVNGAVNVGGEAAANAEYTVNSLTVQNMGVSVRVKTSVTKNSAGDGEDTVVIAMYKNGALVDMIFMEGEFAQGQTVTFGGFLPSVPGAVYKAFVWDDLDDMTSLSNSVEK